MAACAPSITGICPLLDGLQLLRDYRRGWVIHDRPHACREPTTPVAKRAAATTQQLLHVRAPFRGVRSSRRGRFRRRVRTCLAPCDALSYRGVSGYSCLVAKCSPTAERRDRAFARGGRDSTQAIDRRRPSARFSGSRRADRRRSPRRAPRTSTDPCPASRRPIALGPL
jgi:hypothetical protein